MKLIILCSIVALAAAAPAEVQLRRFEQSDGTRRESRGVLKNEGREDAFVALAGSYEWVGPDGMCYVVRTADDDEYQPQVEQEQPAQPEQPREPGSPPFLHSSLVGK
ncbi:endocuticle structural protein SgAbd-6-like [Ostrinia furnacalis]|uniref:endocuticle structural protein SgAbd-6-like n=1 Tax=Ostrinia furnacalis TaxID=93504 RepID=UPI0010408DA3|nr:endocuticle structural protein SgAbd-6-like [Ostrinia furnacalis]